MKNTLLSTTTLVLATSVAQAGGLDRGSLPVSKLFDDGQYVELGFASAHPDVSGTHANGSTTGGNVTPDFTMPSLSYKTELSDKVDLVTSYYQSYGANIDYTSGVAQGLKVDLTSDELAALVKYQINDQYSVFGGARLLQTEADLNLVYMMGYEGSVDKGTQSGYVAGAAFEIKDIALRASLTYQSEIDVELDSTEQFNNHLNPQFPSGAVNTVTSWTFPQAVTFNFQTGIAENTLLFAEVKWAEWTEFYIAPDHFAFGTGGAELTRYENDYVDTKIGLGYKLNDQISFGGSYSYSPSEGGEISPLSPTDGGQSLSLGGSYKLNQFQVNAGVSYREINSVDLTISQAGANSVATNYSGSSAFGYSLAVRYNF